MSVDDVVEAIRRLQIRGAPALGVAGALGVALSARRHCTAGRVDTVAVKEDARRLTAARPTAVNLSAGVQRALGQLYEGPEAVVEEARSMLWEDEAINRRAAANAADHVLKLLGHRPLRILTHCNTGRLATTAWGTALGAIWDLNERGLIAKVIVTETRPLLQGARLTTWELAERGVPFQLCVDAAGPIALQQGRVDCVLVGADRIAANGDVANKIGTYGLALAAAAHNIPFIVVAPESTCDPAIPGGASIPIEERPAAEVTMLGGQPVTTSETPVFNPAFDITPASMVSAIVTEQGVQHLPTATNARGQKQTLELADRIGQHTISVTDFPKSGVVYRDLCAVYAEPRLLEDAASAIADSVVPGIDAVVAVEARGFVLGTAVAQAARVPLILARKAGRLPGATTRAQYDLEYASEEMEIQRDALHPGQRVLVVDDVLATGGTLDAVRRLVCACDAHVVAFAVLLQLGHLNGARRLAPTKVFAVHTVDDPADDERGDL